MRTKPIRRVKSINWIVLESFLQISDEFEPDRFSGTSEIVIGGGLSRFIQQNLELSTKVKIFSNNNGWIHKDTVSLLEKIKPTDDIILGFDDGTTFDNLYHFDLSSQFFDKKQIYDGALWYHITLNLLKG